jgi:hypothetical protein
MGSSSAIPLRIWRTYLCTRRASSHHNISKLLGIFIATSGIYTFHVKRASTLRMAGAWSPTRNVEGQIGFGLELSYRADFRSGAAEADLGPGPATGEVTDGSPDSLHAR